MKLISRKICWSPDWIVEADSTLRNELYPFSQKNGAERPYYILNRKLVCQCDESTSGEVTMWMIESFVSSCKLSTVYFSLTLIINDMKRIYKKFSEFKFKKPSLGSIHGPG